MILKRWNCSKFASDQIQIIEIIEIINDGISTNSHQLIKWWIVVFGSCWGTVLDSSPAMVFLSTFSFYAGNMVYTNTQTTAPTFLSPIDISMTKFSIEMKWNLLDSEWYFYPHCGFIVITIITILTHKHCFLPIGFYSVKCECFQITQIFIRFKKTIAKQT